MALRAVLRINRHICTRVKKKKGPTKDVTRLVPSRASHHFFEDGTIVAVGFHEVYPQMWKTGD